jgi:hypothetical protein
LSDWSTQPQLKILFSTFIIDGEKDGSLKRHFFASGDKFFLNEARKYVLNLGALEAAVRLRQLQTHEEVAQAKSIGMLALG